jgi:hypothetical protein
MKLKAPVENPHKAFCTPGCYSSFYLRRCLVCEKEKPAGSTARRLLCRRPRCESAYRQNRAFYAFPVPDTALTANVVRNADKTGTFSRDLDDRSWRIVAGPESPSAQLRFAIVGGKEAVEAVNRTNLRHWREHNAKAEDRCCLIKHHDPPINFPNAPTVDSNRPSSTKPTQVHNPTEIAADLSVPEFLRRVPS